MPGLTCHPPPVETPPASWAAAGEGREVWVGGITTFAGLPHVVPPGFMSLVKTVGGVTNQPLQVLVQSPSMVTKVSGGEGRR